MPLQVPQQPVVVRGLRHPRPRVPAVPPRPHLRRPPPPPLPHPGAYTICTLNSTPCHTLLTCLHPQAPVVTIIGDNQRSDVIGEHNELESSGLDLDTLLQRDNGEGNQPKALISHISDHCMS